MERAIRFQFYFSCFCVILHFVLPDCSLVYPGSPTFGKDCKYRCHCKDDTACDASTGHCDVGCDFGWMGPGCQYRNVIKDYSDVRHFGEGGQAEDAASLAADGDLTTCSSTDPLYYTGRQYWMAKLKRPYRISGIVLHIPKRDIGHFRGFRIEFGPFWSTFPDLCYAHPDTIGRPEMEIMCSEAFVTQYVRIILNISNATLRLCEVEIYGGRLVSFNRPTSGTPSYLSWTSQQAVDGRYLERSDMAGDARARTCYASTRSQHTWWSVNLGVTYDIQDVYFYGRERYYIESQMEGFVISLADQTSNFTDIYEDAQRDHVTADYLPRDTSFTETYAGSIVQVSRNNQLAMCEILVFAGCPAGKCGWDCQLECHCKTRDITGVHEITGTCPDGCADRWTGVGGKCNAECCETKWGPRCENKCGHCQTLPCSITDGSCVSGCSGPWKMPLCVEACDEGTYGQDCISVCGHCRKGETCETTTGFCLNGCEGGWKMPLCKQRLAEASDSLSFETGIGVGVLALGVLIEAVVIVVLCRCKRTSFNTETTIGESIQVCAFRNKVTS